MDSVKYSGMDVHKEAISQARRHLAIRMEGQQ